jgi:hypothetical protein
MEVTLEQGGGVMGGANHQRLGPVDTRQHDLGKRAEELIAELDFFVTTDDFPHRPAHRSDPTWTSVRVVGGDGDRTIRWDSNHEPPERLKELVGLVESLGEWLPVV